MAHDAAREFLCASGEVVAGRLRLVVPDGGTDWDLGTPEDRPAERFGAEHRGRAGDMVRRGGFREGTLGNGGRPCRPVPIEFRSPPSTGRTSGPDATDKGGQGPVTGGFQARREASARARRTEAEPPR